MSNQANQLLLIRANELAEELASDPAGRDDRILELIKKDDLDTLRHFVGQVEGQLALEHYNNYDLLGQNDVY